MCSFVWRKQQKRREENPKITKRAFSFAGCFFVCRSFRFSLSQAYFFAYFNSDQKIPTTKKQYFVMLLLSLFIFC